MPPIDDDELFDDELEDEDEDDEEYEYEDVDDDDEGEDEGFEEFEDDFAAGGGADVKVKTVPGMDAFALGWAFFATLTAVCVGTWFVLYEVYDWQAFDILPDKERPSYPSINVIGIGRDDSISDAVNYVVLDRGINSDITPGTVIEVRSTHSPNAVITAIVSDEALGNVSKAWITDIQTGNTFEVEADDFFSSQDKYQAIRNIFLMGGPPGTEELSFTATAKGWSDQFITRGARERDFR